MQSMQESDDKYYELRAGIWKACTAARELGMSRRQLFRILSVMLGEMAKRSGGIQPADIENMAETHKTMLRKLRIVELGMEIAEDSKHDGTVH